MSEVCPTCGAETSDETVDVFLRGSGRHFHVAVGKQLRYGRSRNVDVPLGDNPGLSRTAGLLTNVGRGVRVRSTQLGPVGWTTVQVRQSPVSYLAQDDEHVLRAPEFEVWLTITDGISPETYVLEVLQTAVMPDGQRDGNSATAVPTDAAWTADIVLHPTSRSTWKTVVALACVLTVRRDGEQIKFDALKARCQAVIGPVVTSDRWLSNQLERAMAALGIDGPGDRIPRLVAKVQALRLIPDEVLTALEARLQG